MDMDMDLQDSFPASLQKPFLETLSCQQNWGHPQQPDFKGCKCTKIRCLKLYCQCFMNGKRCGDKCICKDCRNRCGHSHEIREAKKLANQRKPGHFKDLNEFQYKKRCNCRKSKCIKKYCECYSAGIKCGPWCKCIDCQNFNPDYKHQNAQMLIQAY